MIKYVHIVQVHPVENGEPNLYKVKAEYEFTILEDALGFVKEHNELAQTYGYAKEAVYLGRVNDATGELE